MKKIIFILAALSLLMSGCGKEYDEVLDESVLSELPSFEYAGYTYYVHPALGPYNESGSRMYDFTYKKFEKEVKALDSYGYKSWFIPSVTELRMVGSCIPSARLLSSSSDYDKKVIYHGEWYGDLYIAPMIKFRKQ